MISHADVPRARGFLPLQHGVYSDRGSQCIVLDTEVLVAANKQSGNIFVHLLHKNYE
jgi:hypothetical protein